MTLNLFVSMMAGVVIGKLLWFGLLTAVRRLGYAGRIERRVDAMFDRMILTTQTGYNLFRNEALLMLVWVVLTVVCACAFIFGMKAG